MRLKRTSPPRRSGGYDTRVQRPSPDEIRRAGKAVLLGVGLGLALLLLARRSRGR
jgi:hypothetical protein